MTSRRDAFHGCLLGLAIGDAMGYPADTKTWPQLQEEYGPYGLLGYDLRNGYAEISSNTQLAVFSCNGLLLGQTRGQVYGKMAPFVRYVHLAQQEWAIGQRRYDQPGRNFCWVYRVSDMRLRRVERTKVRGLHTRRWRGYIHPYGVITYRLRRRTYTLRVIENGGRPMHP